MQEYWELYMKNLEGYPASVLFNAGISMEIEELRYTHPIIAFVKATLKEPKESGLLSKAEEPEILYLEDKLEAAMIKFRIGKYVGRVISNKSVTFLYYVQFTYNWEDFIAFALDEHQSYEITHGYSEDKEWNYYQNLLYPTAKEWQIIQNHKACDQLKETGDNLDEERLVEHTLYFTKSTDREKVIQALQERGFKIKEEIRNQEGHEGLSFYRLDSIFYHHIDELTLELIDLCEAHGAAYDGWQTSALVI